MDLTPEQKAQADKLLSYLQKMEAIVRTTPNEEQRSRVKKEMHRYIQKLDALIPGQNIASLNVGQIKTLLGGGGGETGQAASSASAAPSGQDTTLRVLDKIKIEPASEHCTDPDINFLSSVLHTIDREYWPAISDRHAKLDFSHAAERDGVRQTLDNILRNLEVVTETTEEYATAEKQDFREQLLKMKNRQTRTFIYEANEALKKMREFTDKLVTDVNERGGIVMNRDETIRFNSKYENATMLDGYQLKDAILELSQLIKESIEQLNLPQMKIKQ